MFFTKLLEQSEVLEFFGIFGKKKKKVKYETAEQERRQAVSVAKAAARSAISKLDAKAKKAVRVVTSSDESREKEFISGEEDYCSITSWDLWKYNNKARTDEDTNEVFYDILHSIEEVVNSELAKKTKDKFSVEEFGDWDGGGLDLVINSHEVEE